MLTDGFLLVDCLEKIKIFLTSRFTVSRTNVWGPNRHTFEETQCFYIILKNKRERRMKKNSDILKFHCKKKKKRGVNTGIVKQN